MRNAKCEMRNGFLDKLKAKSAVGLMAVVLGTTIAAIIAVPVTKWFIQVNNATVQTEDRMTSMDIAYNKWQEIVYQPFDDIAEFAGQTKKENAFSGQYEITITYGNIQKVSADKDQRYMECTVSVNKKNALPTDRPYSMKGKKIELDVAGPLPIGAIIPYNGSLSDIPRGWALCDGTNGTPDLRDKFVMGWGSNSANTYKTAGLPNIEGSTISNDGGFPYTPFAVGYIGEDNDKYSSGALYLRKTPNRNIMGLTGISTPNMDREDAYLAFDASRSNSIYGNSSTVQPPAYVVFYIMKVS